MPDAPVPPNSTHDRSDVAAQVSRLAALIQTHLRVNLDEKTLATIRTYMWRVGPANHEDLIAAIFLDCWQEKKDGIPITNEEVRRAADRVRQRLIRESQRAVPTKSIEHTPAVDLPPDDEAELVIRDFRTFLASKSPVDALLFQRFYLDNQRDVAALAVEFGLSTSTVYRKLAAIRTDYMGMRDLRQPPHAAD